MQTCENGSLYELQKLEHTYNVDICAWMHSVSLQGDIRWDNTLFLVIFVVSCEQASEGKGNF